MAVASAGRLNLHRICLIVAACLTGLALVAVGGTGARWTAHAPALSAFFWRTQDWPVLILLLTGLLLWRWPKGTWHLNGQISRGRITAVILALILICWAGHYFLLAGHDLSRDEQMVLFDQAIFARGQLFAILPVDWPSLGNALNRTFLLPLPSPYAWVSAYLPGNAVIHAFFARIGDAHLASPIMAALAVAALYDIAVRIWPDEQAPQIVALTCLILSPQFLISAMTTYAMTAHLALNLLWLALFLRDRTWAYAMLLPIGFLATGLHQPIFHPLFVAPFLWLLVERRRWGPLAILAAGYALIGLFWLAWPGLVAAAVPASAISALPASDGYAGRVMALLSAWKPNGLWLMTLNLLRFATWQNLLLLPLAIIGVAAFWRSNGLVRALTLGPLLTLAAMLILLPYQGHGWGYRYLHGFIGNFGLLAGFGWFLLRQQELASRRLFLIGNMVSLAALGWMAYCAHALVAPYAQADRRIASLSSDFVVIDDLAAPFALDLVRNAPFLDNRPIRLAGSARIVEDYRLRRLCQGRHVAIYGASDLRPIRAYFGLHKAAEPNARMAENIAILRRSGCKVAAR